MNENPSVEAASSEPKPIVFFDGVCNLCHGTVQFIIDRDPQAKYRFISLQSNFAKEKLPPLGIDPSRLDSVVLLQNGVAYQESGAVLRILRGLSGPWPLAFYFCFPVPWFLRDLAYRLLARYRYRIFGRSESCRLPSPELRARFITDLP